MNLDRPPGERRVYSNLAFQLLGPLIEEVAGEDHRSHVGAAILRPLGLTNTAWTPEDVPGDRLAVGHERMPGQPPRARPYWRPGAADAAGGLYSSVEDLARYAAFNLAAWPARDEPEVGPLRRATLREAQSLAVLTSFSAASMRDGPARASVSGSGLGFGVQVHCSIDHLVALAGKTLNYRAALSHLRSLPAGGLAVFGGLFAALAVAAIGCRRFRVPTLAWLDCWAPAVALGGVIERVGAFLAGADFGMYVGPGDLGHVLSVTYPEGSPAFMLHTAAFPGLPGLTETSSAPVHPVQLYLAATCAVAFLVGLALRRRRRFSGQAFLAVAAVFLLGRAVLFEPLRFDASPLALGPLRVQQVSGLGLLLVSAIAWRMLAARAAARPGEARQWEGGPWTPGA
jgi:prolipoprotein diacylglyceryltransferase